MTKSAWSDPSVGQANCTGAASQACAFTASGDREP